MNRELYAVLEVHFSCSAEELKKSYRRLSLIHHPDKQAAGPSSKPADSAAFQELNNAYQTLSDPRRRADYDAERLMPAKGSERSGMGQPAGGQARGGPMRGMDGSGMLMNDQFAEMFEGQYSRGGPGVGGRKVGKGNRTDVMMTCVEVTLEELSEGCTKIFGIPRVSRCGACDGLGHRRNAPKTQNCRACTGMGLLSRAGKVYRCSSCFGRGTVHRIQDRCLKCAGTGLNPETQLLGFFFDGSNTSGEIYSFPGEAGLNPNILGLNSPLRDLEVHFKILPHRRYSLDPVRPFNLRARTYLSLTEMLFGFSRIWPLLSGRHLRITHNPYGRLSKALLPYWSELPVRGWGMTSGEGEKGDLVLRIGVSLEGVLQAGALAVAYYLLKWGARGTRSFLGRAMRRLF